MPPPNTPDQQVGTAVCLQNKCLGDSISPSGASHYKGTTMIIKSDQARGKCDECGLHQSTHAALNQGATGRWCEVMWICHKCAVRWAGGEDNILTAEQARDKCNVGNGWADF